MSSYRATVQENTAKGKSFFKVYWIQAPTASRFKIYDAIDPLYNGHLREVAVCGGSTVSFKTQSSNGYLQLQVKRTLYFVVIRQWFSCQII